MRVPAKAPTRYKFFCSACDHVTKAAKFSTPACPFCQARMENMGPQWRPGKKGRRGKAPGVPQHRETLDPQEWIRRSRWCVPSPGEELLARLLDAVSGGKS